MFKICALIILLSVPKYYCNAQEATIQSNEQKHFSVVSQGWHTGIIISGDCIDDSLWPPNLKYFQFDRLFIGWGDKEYYQNKGFNLWYATKAAVWPTSSTLHIMAFNKNENIDLLIEDHVILEVDEKS